MAFRDEVSLEIGTSAYRSRNLHDQRPAFVPGRTWKTSLDVGQKLSALFLFLYTEGDPFDVIM